jgi:oligoribonuclease NrnB/cAMP/cGMP phosphodiesterase (DHH superfamily)
MITRFDTLRKELEMKTFCVFHRADLDGRCAGAIVKLAIPDAELVGYDHGDAFKIEDYAGHRVVMVDCSLQPFDKMKALAAVCDLTWIDHHKTAIEEYRKQPIPLRAVALEEGTAGCELAWGWAFPDKEVPRAVYLLGRFDVWALDDDPDILPFQYGMRQAEMDPADGLWKALFENEGGVTATIIDGHTIMKYVKQQNATACRAAFEATFKDLECICLNVGGANSQTFESVWDAAKYDAMLAFSLKGGKYWTVSLYTDKEGVDVGAVAKACGGGGHKQAAGFQCRELPGELVP